MKITLEFKKEDLIRMDFIEKAINALLNEKEELEKGITLYWENNNIYVKKMKPKDTYKIYFGGPK